MRRHVFGEARSIRQIVPGVRIESMQPGGMHGPNQETLSNVRGGLVWTDFIMLGSENDDFMSSVPDIRMPPNQYWPLHWHDCAIAVVILEGECLIGDWWMQVGDVLVTEAGLEYGPLVVGPQGCRMFEIFSHADQVSGGYAPEYRDHPTLQGVDTPFPDRSPLNKRNDGRQTLPMDGVVGAVRGHLNGDSQWDLGKADDPERSLIKSFKLTAGSERAAHAYDDWHAIFVLDGELAVAGEILRRDDFLLIDPKAGVPSITAPVDASLLEVSRTTRGMEPIFSIED